VGQLRPVENGYAEVPMLDGDVLWLRPDVARIAPPTVRQPAAPSNPTDADDAPARAAIPIPIRDATPTGRRRLVEHPAQSRVVAR
jgi:hypothetical protein